MSAMGQIIPLPGAAREPVPVPPRQRGRYASSKIVPQGRLIGLRNRNKWEERRRAASPVKSAQPAVEDSNAKLLSALRVLLYRAQQGKLTRISWISDDPAGELAVGAVGLSSDEVMRAAIEAHAKACLADTE